MVGFIPTVIQLPLRTRSSPATSGAQVLAQPLTTSATVLLPPLALIILLARAAPRAWSMEPTTIKSVYLTDPGPLKNNGGPTSTHAPLSNSPAIDRGKDIDATGQDQRGSMRPVTYNDPSIVPPTDGDGSDIGAVELPPGVIPVSAESVKSHGGLHFQFPWCLLARSESSVVAADRLTTTRLS